jgi:hypothetical protein
LSAEFDPPTAAAGWHAICCFIDIDKSSSWEGRR